MANENMTIDLSNMSAPELRTLQARINEDLKTLEKQELVAAREKIMAIAQSVGMPLSDLMGSAKAPNKEKTPVAVRYRHKDDATKQWTGRGRQPNWIKEWVEAGNELNDLLV
jgi:DNA-binding protein H-NS